jgi:hypothetical protein
VDGKLIGAVRMPRSFSKELIAGITDCRDDRLTTFNDVRPPGARCEGRIPLTPRGPFAARGRWPGTGRSPSVRTTRVDCITASPASAPASRARRRPIMTPLVMSGLSPASPTQPAAARSAIRVHPDRRQRRRMRDGEKP